MRTSKSQIVAGISALTLILGIIFAVNADEKMEVKNEPEVLVNETWYFTGDADDNPELASNYSLTADPNKPCDSDTPEVICQIQAPNSGGQPNMSAPVDGTTVQLQIRAAHQSLEGGTPTKNSTVTEFRPE